MKRLIPLILAIVMTAALFSACEHVHVPGKEATCTEAQVCAECGAVLTPAKGHTPGAEATCTEPQLCLVCGAVIAPAKGHTPDHEATCLEPSTCTVCGVEIEAAKGHTPGAEPTCTEAQVCTECGEELQPAAGHKLDANGKCTVCGKQVSTVSQQYTAPGGKTNELPQELVPETANEGHYHNNINAYYNGTVLICGDYGMEYFSPGTSGCAPYAEAVNAFAAKYPNLNVTAAIVPKCAAFQSPEGFNDPYENTVAFINNTYALMDARVKKADGIGTMTPHKGEYMFYRNDHHWTSLGAYYASVAYCEANGITPYALDTYETYIATGAGGSLKGYANGDYHLSLNPDYSVCHYPHTGYLMTYNNGGVWYKGTALNPNIAEYWGMFICGDQPLTVIDTDNKNGRALIVFKESYGNAFVPYMIDYYERIVVVDIRKDTDSVGAIIERYGITDALIINNAQAISGFASTIRSKTLS